MYTENKSIDGLTAITPTIDDLVVTMDQAEVGVAKSSTLLSIYNLFKTTYDTLYAKYLGDADFYKYSIVTSVASGNLTVALKNYEGNDPTPSKPVKIQIGGVIRTISSALSTTWTTGANWCNAGSTELATKEIDYAVYLGWSSITSSVLISPSRIFSGNIGSDFNGAVANEKFSDFGYLIGISQFLSTDSCVNIGRFNATLSAGLAWSIPATSVIINRPIYETRILSWNPTITGYSANPTDADYRYRLSGTKVDTLFREASSGTSNATTTTYTIPFFTKDFGFSKYVAPSRIVDNGIYVTTPGMAQPNNASVNVLNFYKDWNAGVWTASAGKRIDNCQFTYEI